MSTASSPHLLNRAHRAVLRITRGRLGWRAMGMPMLELTTVGRTSGEKRSTMLSSPLQEGGTIVVVASRGGDDRHPAWYLNLVANPEVDVTFKGDPPQHMRARVASAAERSRLWPLITRDHPNYAGYQKKTEREIPVVLLQPADAPPS
jgi:deazaflavin-dependent oxidoreductase (nitroreductase family)